MRRLLTASLFPYTTLFRSEVAHVALDAGDARLRQLLEPTDDAARAVREIVEHDGRRARGGQRRNDVRADVAGAPGDQDSGHCDRCYTNPRSARPLRRLSNPPSASMPARAGREAQA